MKKIAVATAVSTLRSVARPLLAGIILLFVVIAECLVVLSSCLRRRRQTTSPPIHASFTRHVGIAVVLIASAAAHAQTLEKIITSGSLCPWEQRRGGGFTFYTAQERAKFAGADHYLGWEAEHHDFIYLGNHGPDARAFAALQSSSSMPTERRLLIQLSCGGPRLGADGFATSWGFRPGHVIGVKPGYFVSQSPSAIQFRKWTFADEVRYSLGGRPQGILVHPNEALGVFRKGELSDTVVAHPERLFSHVKFQTPTGELRSTRPTRGRKEFLRDQAALEEGSASDAASARVLSRRGYAEGVKGAVVTIAATVALKNDDVQEWGNQLDRACAPWWPTWGDQTMRFGDDWRWLRWGDDWPVVNQYVDLKERLGNVSWSISSQGMDIHNFKSNNEMKGLPNTALESPWNALNPLRWTYFGWTPIP